MTAMTTNQTIDGVPRELATLKLLDEVTELARCGDVQGTLLKVADLLAENSRLQDEIDNHVGLTAWQKGRDGMRAERDSALLELTRLKAAQPQGEPVYQTRWNRLGEWGEWKTVSREQYQRSEGRLFERRIVYAEQPAPVAVVIAEARTWLGDGLNSDGLAQEYWTPEYAALIERIDATLRNTK